MREHPPERIQQRDALNRAGLDPLADLRDRFDDSEHQRSAPFHDVALDEIGESFEPPIGSQADHRNPVD